MCVPSYCRAESVPGRPLTVRAGCPPNLPLQRDASWPTAASTATIVTREAGEGEQEKMEAASSHHAHPLTEMTPLVAGFLICIQAVSLIHLQTVFLTHSLNRGAALASLSISGTPLFPESFAITTEPWAKTVAGVKHIQVSMWSDSYSESNGALAL